MCDVCCYTLIFGMMNSANFFEVLEVMECPLAMFQMSAFKRHAATIIVVTIHCY